MRWLALLFCCAACGSEANAPVAASVQDPGESAPAVVGVWITRGVDETFGEVEVEMALAADGSLNMTLVLDGGARRSFPGNWALEADELVLRGAYFAPAGESRVRWKMEETVLVLEDADGRVQEWRLTCCAQT